MNDIALTEYNEVRELKSGKFALYYNLKDVEPMVPRQPGESRASWKDRCRDKCTEMNVSMTIFGQGQLATARDRNKVITKIVVDPVTGREVYTVDPIKTYESSIEAKKRKLLSQLAKLEEEEKNAKALNVG